MIRVNFHNVRRVLCLGAHADDIEIGCGGTVLRLLGENPSVEVHWVVLGAGGSRTDEASESAHRFLDGAGKKTVIVKGFRDSYFPHVGGAVKECMEELRMQVSPDLILTHRRDDLHQDHRLVSELTWCAFRDHVILEYEIPKYDGDMGRPNLYVVLEEQVCRRKVQTLMECFPSQHNKKWFSEDTYWALLRLRGVECHSPSKYAEGFCAPKLVV
jgi:LmbE family N-acetylglucosaminyl deacetylase